MRGTTVRRASVALGACAALILTGAPSATAGDDESHGRDKKRAAAAHHEREADRPRADRTHAAEHDDEDGDADARQATAEDDGAARADGDREDPPGNNGTIKIDGPEYDVANGNEPHVTCSFAVRFFGFDAGDRADLRVTGQAPTGAGELVASRDGVLVSSDAAGGGQDVDETVYFTAADLDLAGIAPHPKQGYHLKVTADVLGAPGGAKKKVLWLEPCAAAPAVETTAGTGGATGGATGGESTGTLAGTDAALAGTPAPTATATADTIVMGVVASRSAAAAALADAGAAGAAAGDVDSAAATRARGGLLPFTGAGMVVGLVLLAAVLLVVGSGVLAASRRRRTEV